MAEFDQRVVDGAVNGVGGAAKQVGDGLRPLQTGFVRSYALGIAVGAVLLLAYVVTRMSYLMGAVSQRSRPPARRAVRCPADPGDDPPPAHRRLVITLIPRSRSDLDRFVALVASVITGVLSIYMLTPFKRPRPGFQFVVQRDWIADLGISLHFGVDGISLFLVVLTGVIFPLAIIAAKPHHDPKPYYAWLMVLMAASIGRVLRPRPRGVLRVLRDRARPDVLPHRAVGSRRRIYAATKFFLYTMFGSALMLVGIVSAWPCCTRRAVGGPLTFDLVRSPGTRRCRSPPAAGSSARSPSRSP